MIECFFDYTGHVTIVALEDRRTVNIMIGIQQFICQKSEMNCVEQIEIVASSFIMTTPAVTQHVKPLIFYPCPYSLDLSPNDFFLFPNIKNKMRDERFGSPETFRTLISEVTALEWKKCFENWFERMQKCIDLKGEYFEKQ